MAVFHRAGREDLDATKNVNRALVRRVWGFTRAYRGRLVIFLLVITASALLGLAAPLLFKEILDRAIPNKDKGLVTTLALLTVAAALASSVLDLAQRWYSAAIGESLIFDLRTALYDHVHRMPIAFFTRTQTGALVSRMNNDVIGAQRALTGTLGTVVGNVLTLATTLGAMVAIDWRLTLLAVVVLPIFIIPAKRVGARLQDVTREGMEVNAAMNAQMTERFNVSGALLVKLFGRHDAEVASFSRKAGRVRDIGVRSAMLGRVFFGALALVAAVGTAVIYWLGARQVIAGTLTTGALVAMAAFVVRIYQPLTSLTSARLDVLLALVSFERVFELLDTPRLIEDRPGAVELVAPQGRIEIDDVWFQYPAPSEVSIASLEGEGVADALLDSRPGEWVLSG
ncbi:MAG: ABC-type multidrug transport system, ATPase and permease component, partial [Actinomycetia bacterium]|nr:ABC-type multidrug transport system, ATPase and permease component [Actinomycetes bacterium]